MVQVASKSAEDAIKTAQDDSESAQEASKMAQDGPRGPQDAPKTSSRRARRGQNHCPLSFLRILAFAYFRHSDSPRRPKKPTRSRQDGPKGVQDDLMTAQEASKTAPRRGLQVRPRWSKIASKTAQEGPRWPPRRPKRVQDVSESAQEASTTAQDGPRSL